MKTHSVLSASAAERWFNCPGSIRLSKDLPDLKTSEAAQEGTLAHEYLEMKLNNYFRKNSDTEIPATDKIPDDMEEAVEVALNFIKERFSKMDKVLIEHTFDLSQVYPGLFGTADFCGKDMFGDLYVIDYKHGKGIEVKIEDNKQLMYYAVGAIKHLKFEYHRDNVHLVIIQPRCQGNPIKIETKKVSEIFQWGIKLQEAAKITGKPNAPLKSGDWCKFCKASAVCPELNKNMFDIIPQKKELPSAEQIPIEQLIDIIKNEKKIRSWLDSCYDFLQIKAEQGEKIPGFKLVKKKSDRRWVDEEKIKKEFKALGGDIYQPQKLKSPAQLEKLKGINKEVLSSLWEKPDTGVILVSEEDKREEATCDNVDQLFKKLL